MEWSKIIIKIIMHDLLCLKKIYSTVFYNKCISELLVCDIYSNNNNFLSYLGYSFNFCHTIIFWNYFLDHLIGFVKLHLCVHRYVLTHII